MTRQELAKALSDQSIMTKKYSLYAIDNMVEIVFESLCKGEDVQLRRLGTFKVTEQDGRRSVSFVPSRVLIDAMKETHKLKNV